MKSKSRAGSHYNAIKILLCIDFSNYPLVSTNAVLIGSGLSTTFDTQTPSRGVFPLTTFFMIAAAHAIITNNKYKSPPNITINIKDSAFMPSSNTILMTSSIVSQIYHSRCENAKVY